MGCANGRKQIPEEIITKEKYYEDYEEINPYTFNIHFYILTWKKRPDICYFQKITEEVIQRAEIKNLKNILEKMENDQKEGIKSLIKQEEILFYIFCTNGVIITKNKNKINYYISNYLDNIISLCFIDISVIAIPEKEFFSLYEIKRQSKYYFDLNMKEIDFTKRNKLTNDGKMEQLSDLDDIEEEIEKEEKSGEILEDIEIKINKNHFNGEYMINEDDNFLGIKDKRKSIDFTNNNILLDVNTILNKNKNNQIMKEIKDYTGNEKENTKKNNNKNNKNSKNNKINLKKERSLNMTNNIVNEKISRINTKKLKKDVGSSLMTMLSSDRNHRSMEKKSNSKNKNNNKNKELKISKDKIKSDKFLSKNNNKKKSININIKALPLSKKFLSLNNNDSKDENLFINDTNRLNDTNNINNKEEKQEKVEQPPPYEIKDKCLIITTNKLTKEINSELQKILFDTGDPNAKDDTNNNNKMPLFVESCFDHINFYYEERKKKKKVSRSQSILQNLKIENSNRFSIKELMNEKEEVKNNNDINDYIIIFNRNKKPFDKKNSLHKINKVYFTNYKFNMDSIYYLKEFICMLVKYEDLKKIYFNNNDTDMNFNTWKILKQLLRENFNIRWISFKNSNLNDTIFEMVISSLLLKRIRYLNISNNNITNMSMYILNTFLIKNQTLSILDMSNNQKINTVGIKLILKALKLHPNIYKLDISYMNLTGSGEFISGLLSENQSLHSLIIKNDKFNSSDMESISKELSKRESTLQTLDLSENINIGSEGLKEIGKLIYNNISLKTIGLDGMNLSINNYLPIFNGIFKNKNIENYSMSKNEGLPMKGILNFFQKNPQVKKINIIPWDREKEKENKFTEEQIFLLEKFHLKAPQVVLQGINFIDI